MNKTFTPVVFGFSVFLAACSGTGDMSVPDSAAALAGINNQSSGVNSMENPVNETPAGPDTTTGTDTPEISDGVTLIVDSGEEAGPDFDQLLVDNASSIACTASGSDAFRETMAAVVTAARAESRMCGDASHQPTTPVSWNPLLEKAALSHVEDMATVNFFEHQGSDGLGVADRAENAGYQWRAVGENIAAGQLDIAEVQKRWLASPGHCRNIMNSLFTEVGAACVPATDSNYGTYWAVVFGDYLYSNSP